MSVMGETMGFDLAACKPSIALAQAQKLVHH
jgi:hypothetical protein